MVVNLAPPTPVSDLVEAHDLIETERAAVWHQQPMEGHRESRLTEGLNGPRLAENACAGWNQHMLSAVGEHGVRDKAVDGRRSASVQPVGQDRIDDRSLE